MGNEKAVLDLIGQLYAQLTTTQQQLADALDHIKELESDGRNTAQ